MRTTKAERCIALSFLCALISLSSFAQSSVYKPGAPLLMWKVSSATNTAYLVGSLNFADKTFYPLPSVMEDAFAASTVLIVEVGSKNNAPLQMQISRFLESKGTYPSGDNLYRHINRTTRAKLRRFLKSYGYPPVLLARFRPWRAALTVGLLPLMTDESDPSLGVDAYFMNKAGDRPIQQLEDPLWIFKLISKTPKRRSDKIILSGIKAGKNIKEHHARLAEFWKEGAADKIDREFSAARSSEDRFDRAYSRRVREDRNPHMTSRLEKCLHSSESCFMVVGATHCVGRKGIVKQLQDRGYRVEQSVVETAPPATSAAPN